MSDKLEFRVSSGLKDIIGRDLITDDFIAVFELVKNSYDAHAKNVVITIENDKIIIADDGKGMSLDDLKEKWLFVAYSAKKDGTEDDLDDEDKNESYRDKIQEKRHYAGAKGIGRFSSDRLGRVLTLSTQKENSKQIEQIIVDWSKFENNPKDLFQKIKVDYKRINNLETSFPNKSTHGTRLEISGLFEKWTRPRLKNLKHSLEKLINPFSEVSDFKIDIICDREFQEDNIKDAEGNYFHIERNRINGSIKNSILQLLKIKTTQLSVSIDSEFVETRIVDRGTPIYHIKEKNVEFPKLTDLKITLYFLNYSAKNNFTRNMGVRVVNFGSVFLFKNGFRVQPFGEFGDDSWELDQRKQQGYNRFLGTRDLLGSVELVTDDTEQFKEVSSRDGGLIETAGYYQLVKAFREKGLSRLERYVVGVLWGEGFKKRKYFGEGSEANTRAESFRKELQAKDKESENVSIASSNLGSKIDFIQIIKSLVSNKKVEIISFNKDFVDLVNERLDEHQTKFISDLETIADQTNDSDLKSKILLAEKKYLELKKEKEEAEQRADEEERRRKEAEEKAQKEEAARIAAEKKQKQEEEKRRIAELATLKKEKERAEAELAKFKAEQRAKKEAEARKKAESEAAKRAEQITRYKASETIEYKDLRDSNHIIGVYSDDISKKILLLKRKLDKGKIVDSKALLNFIKGISLANEKIATVTRFTTKSKFLQASLETREDIVGYIVNYVKNIYQILYRIDIEIINGDLKFIRKFQPIELSTAIDNILSNSRKKRASKVVFEFAFTESNLQISIRDIGTCLSDEIPDWKLIFEEGITTTKGAGLGLNHVKRIVEDDLGGTITYNPDYTKGFELILIL